MRRVGEREGEYKAGRTARGQRPEYSPSAPLAAPHRTGAEQVEAGHDVAGVLHEIVQVGVGPALGPLLAEEQLWWWVQVQGSVVVGVSGLGG